MNDWRQLLADAIKSHGSVKAVADQIGYARTTLSLVYHDNYPGDTRRVAARILEVFSRELDCPYLSTAISPATCKETRDAPMPTHNPKRLRHWSACQTCPLNPHTPKKRRS